MHMLYNSDNFVVVQFDVPVESVEATAVHAEPLSRGGYEIVDKSARKEIFIEGAMAETFKLGVEALIKTSPSEDDVDRFMERYSSLMQNPVVMH